MESKKMTPPKMGKRKIRVFDPINEEGAPSVDSNNKASKSLHVKKSKVEAASTDKTLTVEAINRTQHRYL
jgi:hypothetical protein